MPDPVSNADAVDRNAVVYLSSPIEFQMADEWYESVRPDHFWLQWRFQAMRGLFPNVRPNERVLEIGCGNSVTRQQFEALYDCPVEGCDVNPAALKQGVACRGQAYFYDVLQRREEWRQYFSLILLLDTLEHISSPVAFLEAIAHHLKPGGLLLVNVPAMQWLYSPYDTAAGHVKRYRTGQLQEELGAAGFSLVQHTYWGLTLLPVAIARKCLLTVTRPTSIIRTGFEPPSQTADRFLRLLMKMEGCLGRRLPMGTSLLALARREE